MPRAETWYETMPTGLTYSVTDNAGKIYDEVVFKSINYDTGKAILVFQTVDSKVVVINLSYFCSAVEKS